MSELIGGPMANNKDTNGKNGTSHETHGGLSVQRLFTTPGIDPLDAVVYEKRRSAIYDADGSVVFAMDSLEIPKAWSQLATDIVVSKYFRKAGVPETGSETSVRQVVYRVARTIREGAEELGGYFATREDADSFEAELSEILINQKGAFNSPVWFNVGLHHRYNIKGSGGNYFWDKTTDQIKETTDAYSHPQASACFIQSISDDLMSIFELVKTESRVFKYGSGSGTNFSNLRGNKEKLSGGGTSSGLMSFLEVFDRAAGATKSGGTTRRAAKMVILDIDHPEIVDFITWKAREEKKVAALIAAGYPADFNGEAYKTVGGQNSNNSVRVNDEFMKAYEDDNDFSTRNRTNKQVSQTYKARDLMRQIAQAAWACADPGMQYDTTINDWHTCSNSGRINASNPCSEYIFLDDTACNLSSINLTKFLREDGSFDIESYRHTARILFIAQEVLVDFSSYPTDKIAKNSHDYRPLGLGYANLGTLLMILGLPYDSDEGRAYAAALTSIMHGEAFKTSAEMARYKGPFAGYAKNKEPMLRVMRKHQAAADKVNEKLLPKDLAATSKQVWREAISFGEKYGYRNAQATVLAPTGTIGLLMDCDTTGVEPDFSLVKFKKLAGGGYFKIVNESVPRALRALNYSPRQINEIIAYARGTQTLEGTPHINMASLKAKGLTDADIEKVQKALPGAFDLNGAFSFWTLGEDTYKRLGISASVAKEKGFNALQTLGFGRKEIEEASDLICGRMTTEGAPHLKPEHYAVFDCANRCGRTGKRFIAPMGHLRMMGAVQPFLSGAISKTVNIPSESTVEDVENLYVQGWKLGLKAVAIYRDGSKLSQPLSTKSEEKNDKKEAKTEVLKTEAKKLSAAAELDTTPTPRRRRLPKKRYGFTQEVRIGGQKLYIRTGEYEDGTLGEIFIDMHKEGAAFRSMMNAFAISVSLGLQYGVPLDEYVDVFTFTRFEPQGITDHPNIRSGTSVLDFIFRLLGMEYLGRTDFVQVPPILSAADDKMPAFTSATAKKLSSEPLLSVARVGDSGPQTQIFEARPEALASTKKTSSLSTQMSKLMGDAPFCDTCGHLTIRNGSCYKCLNCGNSMGCS
jgi:ribonucleoside-diphosphate reductase alpha chain